MEIQIDVNLLIDEGISADDFTALYILYRNGHDLVIKMNLKPNWIDLQEKGFVKLGASPKTHVVRQKFIDLFTSDFDKMFNELLIKYPMKVNTNRGVRILHAKDPSCNANLKAKKKYKRIVGNKLHVHSHIMKCLNKQLELERNNLGYMQNLETWLNNHTWEKYANIDESNDTDTRITRKL
tara:strand:+ start:1222 stop:1764 length:543 start_codon:yes stop_codon:yes gene_type:complete